MKSQPVTYFLPRLRDIFFLALFIAVLALGPRMLNLDGDLPRHLLMGQLIIETGSVPDTEPFGYPYFGRPYVTHEWLSAVILAMIYSFSGLTGIVITSALLISLTFVILFNSTTKRLGNMIFIFLITIWGAAATSLNWVTRPHLFSMLFLAIWLVLTDRLERGERVPLWWFPGLMIIWSNLHGEFIAGMLVLVALAMGWILTHFISPDTTNPEVGKKIWLVLILSFFASLINPAGIGPWKTIFGFLNNAYMMSRMAESNPPNFQNQEFLVLLGMIIFSIFILGIKKNAISTGKALLLAGFTAMSLLAIRNVHLYGIVVPFVLAESVSEFSNMRLIRRFETVIQKTEAQLKGFLWPILSVPIIAVFLVLSGIGQQIYQFSPTFFPVDAVKWLEQHRPQGNMFNNLNWGGYIAFHLWPEDLVFIDSVTDVTGELTRQYETVITLKPGWEDVLAQYQVQWVIIPPDYPLNSWLAQSQAWELLYRDDTAMIWGQQ